MELERKLAILADAAKYDASCASSGAPKRHSAPGKGLGSTTGMGICHSYTPDGRCVSLLKILLTNFCLYDCQYCVNRRSSDIPRARFSANEVVALTLDFYRRNYIEGLFLSSGIIRSSDYTMEQMVHVARTLRTEHDFRGYIHLKTIPEASADVVAEAGRWADRLSVNIELPTEHALTQLAPEKSQGTIKRAMAGIRTRIEEVRADKPARTAAARKAAPRFSPAGQSTQLIVGADDADDSTVLGTADTLYHAYRLRRVYYSAFSPIPAAAAALPNRAPPLMREHRLYQADWLLRFYGFSLPELRAGMPAGKLDLDLDPKTQWALAHRAHFPVDVNRAPRETLLRVPGLGVRVVDRILATRRLRRLRIADLTKLGCRLSRALHFIVTADHRPARDAESSDSLRARLAPAVPQQQALF
ncbi:MAG TPA: putative DNA modification/repair radical SAM protein [Steroidobacteraceae bacterium]|nr:putative DNA modification/repair radical SAM protein [Steroidobacteraceae bacterium]